MSTRCIVGMKTEKGYVGRYAHFDGYPDAKLPFLAAVMERDGAQKAAATLMDAKTGGWSSLDENALGGQDRNQYSPVEGYGDKYNDGGDELYTLEQAEKDVFIEYMYFIDAERGVVEWKSGSGSNTKPLETWTPGDPIPEEDY